MASATMEETTSRQQRSAQEAVLNTYELIENIFLALPPQDYLLAAKVSKTWHAVITTSPIINKEFNPFFLLMDEHYPAEKNLRQCFISFYRGPRQILIRRVGDVEVLAIVRKPDIKSKALAEVCIIDGKEHRLLISSAGRRRYLTPGKDLRELPEQWVFSYERWEFYDKMGCDIPVSQHWWTTTVSCRDIPKGAEMYLQTFYGFKGDQKTKEVVSVQGHGSEHNETAARAAESRIFDIT